jgi:hypothetical protein
MLPASYPDFFLSLLAPLAGELGADVAGGLAVSFFPTGLVGVLVEDLVAGLAGDALEDLVAAGFFVLEAGLAVSFFAGMLRLCSL